MLYAFLQRKQWLRIECILLKFHWGMKALTEVHFQWSATALHVENVVRSTLSFKNWIHSFEVSLGYESVDRSTFSMKRDSASCWKYSSINAFIPLWNFKRMHSILINIFKSHPNVIWLNNSLWILFVRLFAVGNYYASVSSDWSFIVMWNISFIIMWPLHNQSYCNISMKNGSNVIIIKWKTI